MRKTKIAGIILASVVLGVGVLLVVSVVCLFLLPNKEDPSDCQSRFVEPYIVDPVPSSMRLVKVLDYASPTFGDGMCVVAYEMAPTDFAAILKNKKWESGWTIHTMEGDGTHESEKYYHQVWPDDCGPFETYSMIPKDDNSGSGEMVASKSHTRVVFLISDM